MDGFQVAVDDMYMQGDNVILNGWMLSGLEWGEEEKEKHHREIRR